MILLFVVFVVFFFEFVLFWLYLGSFFLFKCCLLFIFFLFEEFFVEIVFSILRIVFVDVLIVFSCLFIFLDLRIELYRDVDRKIFKLSREFGYFSFFCSDFLNNI